MTQHYKIDITTIDNWQTLQRLLSALDIRFTDTFPKLDNIRDLVIETDPPEGLLMQSTDADGVPILDMETAED